MDYNYYRELKHNYLIFEDKQKEGLRDNYQYRIAQSGRVKGLVPCAERGVNGRTYLYYEINSMQSLKDRYASKGMNLAQLTSLLKDIKNVLEELSEFLMGDENLIFNTSTVYTDLVTGECRFVFCPFYDESRRFSDFTMELLELVDQSDNAATELCYNLCERSSEHGDFIYEIIEETLKELGSEQKNEIQIVKSEPIVKPVSSMQDYMPELAAMEPKKEKHKKNSRMKLAEKRLDAKAQLIMAVMFMFIVAGMAYVRKNYILSSEENMVSLLVILASFVTGIISFVGAYKQMGKKDKKEQDKPQDDFLVPEAGADVWEDFSRSEISVTDSFGGEMQEKDFFEKTAPLAPPSPDVPIRETKILGETENESRTLFSTNREKTIKIVLNKLPMTIGKMEGCVDKVIGDDSVSRIHCRLEEDGDRIVIRDLGSTNGTFRNGVRLVPQQGIFLEEGDEIRLGRVCFDCR